ncbi:MAG TPA: cytochrome P450, partial [Acidimicrobiales bacterium]|nr:cytochrome P450 [Acidimicrobiales bacterium]
MLSAVIHAELTDEDPPRLSAEELSAFFSLLFSAGAETTRNAIAGAMLAFLDWPEQLALLRAGDVPTTRAVEEILRWTTPSPSKRRTATVACRLGGQPIEPGQKVVVWEGSANRDEMHFTEPDAFRLGRDPNPHLTFGHGVHFCLG